MGDPVAGRGGAKPNDPVGGVLHAVVAGPLLEASHQRVGVQRALVAETEAGTGQIVDALAAQEERIDVLHRQKKEGLGQAYIAGFRWALAADYDFIFEMDADFSHRPIYLKDFFKDEPLYYIMAVREGFEPSVRHYNVRKFSKLLV